MADDNIRLGIAVETDDPGVRKAKQDLANVRGEINKLKDEFRRGSVDSAKFATELNRLNKEERALVKSIDAVTGEFTRQAAAEKQAAIEARNLAREQAKVAKTQAAAQLASTGGRQLQRIGRDIRGLPSVQVPGLGIGTDTFGRAAEVAGRLGVSLTQLAVAGGITAVAIGAVAIAFKRFMDEAKKQADELNAVIDARRKVGEDVAQGLTSDDARQRIEELNRLREAESAQLDRNKAAYQSSVESQNAVFETILKLTPQEQALADQIDQSTATVAAYETESRALQQALDDGRVAANDAEKAERELAAARTAGILQEAQQAGELASLKERAATLTQEQIDKELEALSLRNTAAEAERAALQKTGDTSDAVTQKIAALTETLSFLGEQSTVLQNARQTARSSEAEKAREKAAKEAEKAEQDRIKAAEKAQSDAARAQEQYTEAVRKAGQKLKDARADIAQDFKDTLSDVDRDFGDDLAKQNRDFNRDQLREEQQLQNDILRIRRDAGKAERDAVRSRDFAAARDARDSREERISERLADEQQENDLQLQAFREARQERAIERQLEIRDTGIDADRARRDAAIARDRSIRDAQQSLNAEINLKSSFYATSLAMEQNYLNRRLQMQDRAQQGSTGRNRNTSASGSTGASFDDLLQDVIGVS